MIINRSNLSILYTALLAAFTRGFDGLESQRNIVSTEIPSTTAQNAYAWLGAFPQLREWVGERQVENLKQYNYVLPNKTFESTISVPREAVEDDQYGLYTPVAQELGRSAAEHPDTLVFNALMAGFTTTCYDGQYFFDIDHPVTDANGNEQSVSNFQAGGGNPWFLVDDSRAVKPIIFQLRRKPAFVAKTQLTDDNVFDKNEFKYGVDGRWNAGYGLWQLAYASKAALDQTNFNAAYTAMLGMVGDRGRKLGIRPRVLVVGSSNRAAALEVVKSERLANGATNVNRDVVRVEVVPWLP